MAPGKYYYFTKLHPIFTLSPYTLSPSLAMYRGNSPRVVLKQCRRLQVNHFKG
jgi:hypothetical protein